MNNIVCRWPRAVEKKVRNEKMDDGTIEFDTLKGGQYEIVEAR